MGEVTARRSVLAQIVFDLLAVYLIFSTIVIWGWVGVGTYASIDHNKDAEYCDYYAAPPGYTNFISGQGCKIRWGYIAAKHGLLILIVSLIAQSPALAGILWLKRRYPSGE